MFSTLWNRFFTLAMCFIISNNLHEYFIDICKYKDSLTQIPWTLLLASDSNLKMRLIRILTLMMGVCWNTVSIKTESIKYYKSVLEKNEKKGWDSWDDGTGWQRSNVWIELGRKFNKDETCNPQMRLWCIFPIRMTLVFI